MKRKLLVGGYSAGLICFLTGIALHFAGQETALYVLLILGYIFMIATGQYHIISQRKK